MARAVEWFCTNAVGYRLKTNFRQKGNRLIVYNPYYCTYAKEAKSSHTAFVNIAIGGAPLYQVRVWSWL